MWYIARETRFFYYDGETLEIASGSKYLGVVFTTSGSFAGAQTTSKTSAEIFTDLLRDFT